MPARREGGCTGHDQITPGFPLDADTWCAVTRALELSAQQARIVEGVLRARCDKQIAAEMGLKLPTVRTYLKRICDRLGVNGRLELALRVLVAAMSARCGACPRR